MIRKPSTGSLLDYADPINDRLLGCWLLNEMGGVTLQDSGPLQKDMTLTNGAPNTDWQGSLFGGCLLFNGTNEYGQVTFPNYAGPFTVHALVRFSSTGAYQSFFSYSDSSAGSPNGNSGFRLGMDGSNSKLSVTFGGVADYDFNHVLSANKWYNIVITMPGNSATCTAYVMDEDFTRTITTLTTGTMVGTPSRITIGTRGSDDSNWLNGRIGCVRFWNRTIAQDEAALLHHNPFTGIVDEDDFTNKAAASGVTGTLAKTNANDTLAATGTTTVTGTLAKTNANDTLAATGTTTVTGSLAKTNANDTLAASGTTTITGSLAKTNANDALAASGNLGVTGTLAKTNANDSVVATGTTTVTGTLAKTNANDTLAASGVTGNITGTLAYTNVNDSVVATGIATNPTAAAPNVPGQLGDPRPRRDHAREHWPKQGIGYEAEYRLLQEANAEADRLEAERIAAGRAAVKALKTARQEATAKAQADAMAKQEAYAMAEEAEQIQKAIAALLQEDEDAMSLIMELV